MTEYTYTLRIQIADDSSGEGTAYVSSEPGPIISALEIEVGRDYHHGACDLGSAVLSAIGKEHYGQE